MATKKASVPSDVYQLKITLEGARPPIWRRVVAPAGLTLEELHDMMQAVMRWENCHLHEFRIGEKRYGVAELDGGPMDETGCVDERKVRLCDVLKKVGAKAEYTYDFGDGWEHGIVVEKVLAAEPGCAYPVCTGGARSGPPEDCGGIYGYANFLKAIHDPKHRDHEELLAWIGGSFDAEAFSVDGANRGLAPLQRKWAKKAKQ